MRLAFLALTTLGALLMSGVAQAETPDIPAAYVVAAEDNGIPPAVLYAVAMTESKMSLGHAVRPWPWTLNVGGKGYRYDTRDEACTALRSFLKQTRVVDVGIAQMNVRWQTQVFAPGKRFADPCAGLDPYANLDEAARVIRRHYDVTRNWLLAAGRYHRPAGGRPAARYRAIVSRELARLGGSPTLGADSPALLAARNAFASTRSMPAASTKDIVEPREDIIWVTPSPRSSESEVSWVSPTARRWTAEVASR